MNVLVDVDGVCADFVSAFYLLARARNPQIPAVTTHTQTAWYNWEGMSREEVKANWTFIKQSPTYWASLHSLMSQADKRALLIAGLTPGISLYFCTSRPGYNVKQQTEIWLKGEIPGFLPTILVAERAHNKPAIAMALDINLSLEDNAENAHEIGKVIGAANSYILPRLYNRNFGLNPDCSSIAEFLAKTGVKINIE